MAGSTEVVPGERRPRPAALTVNDLETVGRVYVSAMRHHRRKAALLEWRGGQWRETPDWRLDRQVIRLGLYLYERARMVPGDRVVILSPLRAESLLAEWSAVVQGAAAIVVDPDLPVEALAQALEEVAPRIAFVSGPGVLERLEASRGGAPGLQTVIAFEGDRPRAGALLSEALDLGGTLDTPERAGGFRERAREVGREAPALGTVRQRPGGRPQLSLLTQGAVAARLRRLWSSAPARPGDVAYVAEGAPTLAARLAILALVGDGLTTTALGTPGRELDEMASLVPHQIVAAPPVIAAAMARAASERSARGVLGWLGAVRRLGGIAGRLRHRPDAAAGFGGRLRRARATLPLDAALAARLRGPVAVDVDLVGE